MTTRYFWLDVSYNLIEVVASEEELFLNETRNSISSSINLENNPLNCDCSLRWLAYNHSSFRSAILRNISPNCYRFDELYSCSLPRCASPLTLQGLSITSLSPSSFACPPRLDPNATLTAETMLGDTLVLRCPTIGADPPVWRYDWIFTPSTSSEVFVNSGWDYFRQTETEYLTVQGLVSAGTFICRPLSPHSSLSINISVSVKESTQEILTTRSWQPYITGESDTNNGGEEISSSLPFIIAVSSIMVILLVILMILGFMQYRLVNANKAIQLLRGTTVGQAAKLNHREDIKEDGHTSQPKPLTISRSCPNADDDLYEMMDNVAEESSEMSAKTSARDGGSIGHTYDNDWRKP
ncbi:hypothetical protein BSL78_26182 [Apostichopus japonicus]|uniref:Ig-like domain-containing protein n=1 Tax=Stichopus japonicus TaxID=307972 RepID=A0A2G8JMJ8_STIJA|nr:hypothetical protein BSL78_26182 [Apostichopus japonicus]